MVDPAFWCDRPVLVTGHTGFKGAWLSLWLQALGSRVHGLSLGLPGEPCLYELARVGDGMAGSVAADVRDAAALARSLANARPEIVFHLAAQPLVRRSYAAPLETFETNALGTANLLESVRSSASVRAVVVVTSDKCYESAGAGRPHSESDPLGGHDPYSASKAAAELITDSYRRSFLADPAGPRVASARAGNVIGGGDWGEDRLIPDLVRAALAGVPLRLRNPAAVRPWQHVSCPLSGYLLLAQALCADASAARAWNFGPDPDDTRSVEEVVRELSARWPSGIAWETDPGEHPHETSVLALDSALARDQLGWRPPLGFAEAIEATAAWYAAWRSGADMREATLEQIRALGARGAEGEAART